MPKQFNPADLSISPHEIVTLMHEHHDVHHANIHYDFVGLVRHIQLTLHLNDASNQEIAFTWTHEAGEWSKWVSCRVNNNYHAGYKSLDDVKVDWNGTIQPKEVTP